MHRLAVDPLLIVSNGSIFYERSLARRLQSSSCPFRKVAVERKLRIPIAPALICSGCVSFTPVPRVCLPIKFVR